jgi:hypothetical protein
MEKDDVYSNMDNVKLRGRRLLETGLDFFVGELNGSENKSLMRALEGTEGLDRQIYHCDSAGSCADAYQGKGCEPVNGITPCGLSVKRYKRE